MVSSMTGFGRADAECDGYRVIVEIRSVNHRFLEVSTRLPRRLSTLEPRLQTCVRNAIVRGKVNVTVILDGEAEGGLSLRIDDATSQRYLQLAEELKTRYGLRGAFDLQSFLGLPGVVSREEGELSEQEGWALVEPTIDEALASFQEMRRQEGALLAEDLGQRIAGIREVVERAATCVPEVVARTKRRLQDRLAEISEDHEYNRFRLEAEVTFFAERADITEECVRLRAHCDQFENFLADPNPAGRKLKFLLEEMHREVNTIGSKSQDTRIAHDVINMKEEVEKIREQVQNIE